MTNSKQAAHQRIGAPATGGTRLEVTTLLIAKPRNRKEARALARAKKREERSPARKESP